MPILTVCGLPLHINVEILRDMRLDLQSAASSVPDLKLTEKDIIVNFNCDPSLEKTGDEIIVFVDLFEKPERTPDRLQSMGLQIVTTVREYFRATTPAIECYPRFLDKKLFTSLPKGATLP